MVKECVNLVYIVIIQEKDERIDEAGSDSNEWKTEGLAVWDIQFVWMGVNMCHRRKRIEKNTVVV